MLTDEMIADLQEKISLARLADEDKISIDLKTLQILVNVHRNLKEREEREALQREQDLAYWSSFRSI